MNRLPLKVNLPLLALGSYFTFHALKALISLLSLQSSPLHEQILDIAQIKKAIPHKNKKRVVTIKKFLLVKGLLVSDNDFRENSYKN